MKRVGHYFHTRFHGISMRKSCGRRSIASIPSTASGKMDGMEKLNIPHQ